MAASADDMLSRLFSGAATDAPEDEAQAVPKSGSQPRRKAQPKPKPSAQKAGSSLPPDSDGSRLFHTPGEGERKTVRIQLMVKESERERWREAAKRYDVSLTQFIETVVNDFCERDGL